MYARYRILALALGAVLLMCSYRLCAEANLAQSTSNAINDAFSQISTGGAAALPAQTEAPVYKPEAPKTTEQNDNKAAVPNLNQGAHTAAESENNSANPFNVDVEIKALQSASSADNTESSDSNAGGSSAAGQKPVNEGGQSGSQPGSQTGNQPGSQEGNQPGSQEGSQPGSQEGSQSGSQTGNQPGSNAPNAAGHGAIITAESKVLHIGDSHSCGVYGKTIDTLMRQTGAAVNTYAVAGSSPSYWLKGTTGKCGYYSKDQNGKVTEPYWQTPMATPLLKDLVKQYKPNVLVVSLGANMVGYGSSYVRGQIKSLCEIGKANGCKIVWVGPPDSDILSAQKVDELYKSLKSVISDYDGVLIDSRKYTEYPNGEADGLHYSGKKGRAIAKTWANDVMNEIQGE